MISCAYFEFAHSHKTFFDKLFSSRKRVCSLIMGATAGCMVTGGRYPIGDQATDSTGEKVRYVTASGTDLVRGQRVTTIAPMKPGSWSIFPPMGIALSWKQRGVIVFDESTLHGRLAAPIRLHIGTMSRRSCGARSRPGDDRSSRTVATTCGTRSWGSTRRRGCRTRRNSSASELRERATSASTERPKAGSTAHSRATRTST